MNADPAIWSSRYGELSRSSIFNARASETRDPTKIWIAFLMDHGGFLTLLGLPACVAAASFVSRMRWLTRNRKPHNYGRTNLIYWPSQIFIAIACLVLIAGAISLGSTSGPTGGLFLGTVFTFLAWAIAIPLNTLEHQYEIRSSDHLFAYYLVTLWTSSIALFILSEDDDQQPHPISPFRFLSYFAGAISVAFFFEAYPRTNTRVQRLSRKKENLNEWQQANLFSRTTFHFVQRIISLGVTRPLTGDDLVNMTPDRILTKANYDRVERCWEKDKAQSAANHKQPNFLWTVLRAYQGPIFVMLTLRVAGFILAYFPPVLFGQLLQFIEDYSRAVQEGSEPPALKIGFTICVAMLFFNLISSYILCIAFQNITDLGAQTRSATIALIYRKSLKLSPQAKQSCTLGEITNHMSVDAEQWIEGVFFMPLLVTIPVELIISIFLLYRLLGWSLLAGLAVFIVLVPVQAKTASFMNSFQEEQLKWMDGRLRLMTEILSNIKIVKLYNWEAPFRKKIDMLRGKEMHALKGIATVHLFMNLVFSSVSLLMTLFTFCAFAYIGGPNMTPGKMTSEVIFVSITLFGMMNRPLGLTAHAITNTIAIGVAMKRVQRFLLMEEIDTTVVRRYSRQPRPSSPRKGQSAEQMVSVDIENGTFAWEKEQTPVTANMDSAVDGERQPLLTDSQSLQPVRPTLSNITLRIPDGSLTAIVGRIGQGKSSLLSVIMGELYKRQGSVTVYGDLAYVPQQAWIINATVRDNILFGKPFDKERYERIIFASGLQPDIEMLSAGDQTEIGERGINLSGGQKQRVSLARAVYQDADIYLLDDPLSAVDAHVDQHLWQSLIGPDGLLKDKTRILVTHGIHHLEDVDQIVVLKNGEINEVGEYKQLIKSGGVFHQLIKDYSVVKKKKKHSSSTSRQHLRDLLHGKKETKKGGNSSSASVKSSDSMEESFSDSEGASSERNTIVEEAPVKTANSDADKDSSGELIEDEKMEAGKVGWNVILIYAKAVSYRYALICIIMFVLVQSCHVGTNFWLRYWISDTEARERDGEEERPVSYYLFGYGGLVILYMCLDVIVNYMAGVVCGIRASKAIYDRLQSRVLRLPMSFFDVTPMGRIVNRFSSDIHSIDRPLPPEMTDLFTYSSIFGSTLLVIAYSTPIFLVAIPPLLLSFFWVQNYFIKSSSSIKRLYSVSKSPLYQHFSESMTGVSTIRVMKGLQEQFIHQNEVHTDLIVSRMNVYDYDNRWLQIRLEGLGGVTVFTASVLAVLNAGTLDPSLVGLALSYSMSMVGYINFLVRIVSEVQNSLVSVERVDEYSQKPTEAPVETGARLPENWPAEGRIVFKNYSARYREGLDLVVKDVSFTVEPTQSIGIVGRTGAGKSSLTLALFRIIEAADSYWARASDPKYSKEHSFEDQVALYSDITDDGGSIEIDGIDISTLGLRDLRQHLSIIPQDPTLFAGTVRENLDPFEEKSDKDIWEALERSHLKDHISSLTGGLSFEVAQNGENFSVGQRSLICLARALLRKTKVLVLDEATAAVDVETDELIQRTIRKEFKDRTVLTIAHRIKTVMDSDKILVLEKGRVQEYEAPSELLQRKDSLFYKLAEQAGEI